MRYDEILDLVANSTPEEWNKIVCWGGGGGPSFLNGLPGEDGNWTAHEERASYKPDVSVGLAWGITSNDDFKEEWANQFPDPHASSEFVDVLYNGMLVYRDIRVIVDGGRVGLPLPDRNGDDLTITRWQASFFGLFQELTGGWDFAEYVGRAAFRIV